MTQDERRIELIRTLQAEGTAFANEAIPADEAEQKDLLRALVNVRMPAPVPADLQALEDAYLQAELQKTALTNLNDLTPSTLDPRLYLWQGDITTLKVDAIVNAANSGLTGCYQPLHNCIDNIIHTKAGMQLRYACNCLMEAQGHPEPVGQAKITAAYNLPCKYVLHTVGPMVQGELTEEHERLLASCYTSCLDLAAEKNLKSVAFCCISTGVFMFPNQRAAEIAVETVRRWLDEHTDTAGTGTLCREPLHKGTCPSASATAPRDEMKVIFNVFKDEDLELYRKLLKG